MSNLLFGRNPVMEALKSGREIEKLLLLKNGEGSIRKIEGMARDRNIPMQYVEKPALDRILAESGATGSGATGSGAGSHQGVVAYTSSYRYYEVEDLLSAAAAKGEAPFLVLLDGILDPHNLGAILRTADGAGAHGVIIQKRRAVGLTEVVAKASAGAIEYIPVAKVVNLVETIKRLKTAGLWIAASEMEGEVYDRADLTGPIGLVIGGEGQGVSRLVREVCDFHVSIPMEGAIESLNASNAAAILLYEIRRQRKGTKSK